MPEVPADAGADWERYLPEDRTGDQMVNVAMPRSALRALERDARAFRQAQTQTQGAEESPDTPLEDGEADMGRMGRDLRSDAPADQVQPGDPYAEARRIFDKIIADGGREREAIGAALNSVVNAAARGDKRVTVEKGSTRAWRGGMDG